MDSDPRYVLTEQQYAKLRANGDFRTEPRRRFAQLDNCAQTLTSSYRSGNRNELIFRPGAARPRFLTPRECARLQGFPEECPVAGEDVSILANANRAYHQLGNAVCPVIVAAIACAALEAAGVCVQPRLAGTPLLRGRGVRWRALPALELLLAAAPGGYRSRLRASCQAFLDGAPHAPAGYAGHGASLLPGDLELTQRQLACRTSRSSQCLGLFTVSRAAYLETGKVADMPIVHSGLLVLVAACLESPSDEVRHLALVALALVSRRAPSALRATDTVRCQLQMVLRESQRGPDDFGLGRLAQETLTNIEATVSCSSPATQSEFPGGSGASEASETSGLISNVAALIDS